MESQTHWPAQLPFVTSAVNQLNLSLASMEITLAFDGHTHPFAAFSQSQ